MLGHTGSHTQPRSPPSSARGSQPKQALGCHGLLTQPRSLLLSAWPHKLPNTAPPPAPYNTLLQAKPQYSLFTATPMPVPPNAIASEPPQVAHNFRAQILAEIQDAGSRGGPIPNRSTSLFRTNISVTHPLKPLLDDSLDTILQAFSLRTLQSYMTAWRCFKSFHLSYNMLFPDFSLLSITSFISFLNSIKGLQVSSIKGYLSGIQFFHKLMYGAPSPEISNSQTSILIRGIQRSRPTRPDSRLPITLDILTICIHSLRTNYQPPSTACTLNAMFILAFFGFLRCSELTISSKFDPDINPTISVLTVLDSETISFLIKQSKTDHVKKGHFIYIFKLSSPIQPYQAVLKYLCLRISQAKSTLKPLFIDDDKKKTSVASGSKKHLRSILLSSGIPARNFSSHSFRIGAATSAAPPKKASPNSRSKP